jgi:transposase
MTASASIKVCDPVSVPASLLADLSDLRAELKGLRQENERLRLDNERLQRELAQAKADLDQTRRQSKRQAAPFSKGAPKAHPKTPGRKRGAAHGRHGHRPPPPGKVDEILEATLPDTCPHCGGSVQETEVATQFQTEIPRRPLIRQFNVHVGCCRGCRARLQGRHPLQTSDALGAAASQIGPDAQAAVVTLNKTFGLSHGKVSAVLRTLFGIGLTRGASVGIVLRAAHRLGPAHQQIREEIKASACLTPDETGWRVGGKPAWLHAWVAERATCYAIDRQRSACVLERLIGVDWSGKMTHDGMASYDRFTRATHQQCVGHVLRRVREMEATAVRGAVHYPRKLIQLFTEAIHLRNQHLRGEATAQQLQEARTGFDRRLEELAYPPREVPAYETLSKHLWNHLGEWFVFLDDPEVEPTNWEAEQAIRPAVVNRKVWGGNRTGRGACAQGVLMSVLQTCKQAGRAALEFVSQTLRAFTNSCLPCPILLSPVDQ